MIAVAWATLGVLATAVFGLFAALFTTNASLNQRIDALGGGLTARIDTFEANLNARIDSLDARLSGRIDGLKDSLETHIRPSAG